MVNTSTAPQLQLMDHSQSLPQELLAMVASYLSVRDVCRIRMVSRFLHASFGQKATWISILRDIMTVKPIVRYQEMLNLEKLKGLPTEYLINQVVTLAKNDYNFGDANCGLRILFETNHKSSPFWKLIPGGRYYFKIVSLGLAGIFDTFTHNLVLQLSYLTLSCAEMVPYSEDDVLIAMFGSDKTNVGNGRASVYLCNPSRGTCSLFLESPETETLYSNISFTRNTFLIAWEYDDLYDAWYQPLDSTQPRLSLRLDAAETHDTLFSIGLLNDRYFALCNCNGIYLFSVADCPSTKLQISLKPIWKIEDRKNLHVPLPIGWPDIGNMASPPRTFAIWETDSFTVLDRVKSRDHSWSYHISQTAIDSRGIQDFERMRGSSQYSLAVDTTEAIAPIKLQSHLGVKFCLSTEEDRAMGCLRLDRSSAERVRVVETGLASLVPSDHNLVHVSYDEESGIFLAVRDLSGCPETSLPQVLVKTLVDAFLRVDS